jgi:O-antigen/teichoic acid export membrane protein
MPPEREFKGSVFALEKSIEESLLNFSFLGISKVLVHVLHLATLALITRRLGPELFGQMSIFLMITQCMYLLTSSWTGVGYTRYSILHSTEGKSMSEVFWSRNLLIFGFISLTGLIIVLGRDQLLSYLQLPPLILIIVFLHFFSLLVADYTRQLAQVATEFKSLAILQLIEKAALFILIVIWGKSLFAILILYIVTAVGFGGYFFLIISHLFYWPFRLNLSLCKKILSFSYPLILTSIGGFIFGWVDIVIIKHFFPFSKVGVYSLAYSGLGTLESIVLLMPMVLTPIFVSIAAQRRDELTERFLQRVLPQIAILWGFFIMLLGLVSLWVIPIIFGPAFIESANIFLVLLIPLSLSVLNGLSVSIFIGYEMVSKMVLVNFSASLINLCLDLVFVPWIGIMGAAVATTLSYCFISVSYYGLIRRRFDLAPTRLALFIAIITLEIIGLLLSSSTLMQLSTTIIAAGLFILGSKCLDIFSHKDKDIYSSLEMPAFLKKVFIAICDYYG